MTARLRQRRGPPHCDFCTHHPLATSHSSSARTTQPFITGTNDPLHPTQPATWRWTELDFKFRTSCCWRNFSSQLIMIISVCFVMRSHFSERAEFAWQIAEAGGSAQCPSCVPEEDPPPEQCVYAMVVYKIPQHQHTAHLSSLLLGEDPCGWRGSRIQPPSPPTGRGRLSQAPHGPVLARYFFYLSKVFVGGTARGLHPKITAPWCSGYVTVSRILQRNV